MARPKNTRIKKQRVALTLSQQAIEVGHELAHDGNESLSQLIDRLLRKEAAHPTGQLFDEGSPSVGTAALDILHRAKNAPSKGKTQPPKSSKKRPSVRG